MKTETKEKSRLRLLYGICPVRHTLMLIALAVIALHLLLRDDHALMVWLSERIIHPAHRILSKLCSHVPFSVAEVLICAFFISLIAYTAVKLAGLGKAADKGKEVYIIFLTPICAAVCVYALFCVMWGTYYYGDDFTTRMGLSCENVSTQRLADTTRYFARLANEYADKVSRDENGVYNADREELLERSSAVFENAEKIFPCLAGDGLCAKGFRLSPVLSCLDFTGFFFPFTGEANVNTDFPPALFAATVAHELSHQRGVAREQEANFVAVLASLEYGDDDYVYSAALLAYTHLGNALYKADREAWLDIYNSLDENIIADFENDRAYWQRFETPVQSVSDTVYEGFLQSYDQELGLRSYGACVDLLVNYYG